MRDLRVAVSVGSAYFGAMPAVPAVFRLSAMRGRAPGAMLEIMDVRCLIVDDNDDFVRVACDALDRDGIDVVGVASNSAEALQRIGEFRPDVALVDICLGDEFGFELVDRIADVGAGDRTAVILTSTCPESEFAEMIEFSDAVAFLSKSDLSGRAIRAILRCDGHGPCAERGSRLRAT
jgi:CheY-like chemotaxis protein